MLSFMKQSGDLTFKVHNEGTAGYDGWVDGWGSKHLANVLT